jgi:heme A synthase
MYRDDLPTWASGEAESARTEAALRPSGESMTRIVRRLSRNVIAMLQIYAVLGKEEARRIVRSMVLGTLFLGVAAILGVYVVSLMLATGILALSTVMRPWLAALIMLLVAATVMAIFALLGIRRLKPRAVINVIHQFLEDVRWLRHEILGNS